MGLFSAVTDRIKTVVKTPFKVAGEAFKGAMSLKWMGVGLAAAGVLLAVPTLGASLGVTAGVGATLLGGATAGSVVGAGVGAMKGSAQGTVNFIEGNGK
jgi:hypothetical protein